MSEKNDQTQPEQQEGSDMKQESPPQGKLASAIRESMRGAKEVAKWGPDQAIRVSFISLLIVMIAMIGVQTYYGEQARRADREAAVAAQAQILRYAASESELQRQFTAAEMEKQRAFHTAEAEKVRAAENTRREESAKHMKEAFDSLRMYTSAIDKLSLAIDRLKLKFGGPDSPQNSD